MTKDFLHAELTLKHSDEVYLHCEEKKQTKKIECFLSFFCYNLCVCVCVVRACVRACMSVFMYCVTCKRACAHGARSRGCVRALTRTRVTIIISRESLMYMCARACVCVCVCVCVGEMVRVCVRVCFTLQRH